MSSSSPPSRQPPPSLRGKGAGGVGSSPASPPLSPRGRGAGGVGSSPPSLPPSSPPSFLGGESSSPPPRAGEGVGGRGSTTAPKIAIRGLSKRFPEIGRAHV